MSRKGNIRKRKPTPDAKYNSILVTQFVNKLMFDGKKGTAENILYKALQIVHQKLGKDEMEVLEASLRNIAPEMEVKSRRVGGATYQVPVEVAPGRKNSLAMKWVIGFSRDKSGKPMFERLATELIDGYNRTGSAIKKREETHKMAEANKAFAHYRW